MIHPEDTKGENTNCVTIGEAARCLGVGRKIIYQLIEFEMIRAGRRRQVILVDRDSLDEFQRSGKLT